ncbi:aminopeptidase P family protein [Rubrimonas cliftonensis]|uniref:Creatinase n=1 Tax=Rubrimonas cliftonensis TaxID=89524 RepID=A0A1H4BXW0_9RHOB|nr:aminopeptidase P family protein [Rubrimonas cliftonensis]SEA53011.1 creatinase [Rubrimonas cliftonensis]
MTSPSRPAFLPLRNGPKAPPPFAPEEYAARLAGLRAHMAEAGVEAALLTSMHCVAYYTGFLYCSFGRSYAAVVTQDRCVVVAALIDHGQPFRRAVCETLTYTDWARGNFWRAVASVAGGARRVGVERDALTLAQADALGEALGAAETVDVAAAAMRQRMIKSPAEIALIRTGAAIADIGGAACKAEIRPGVREIDVAMAGRDAMERAIAERLPDSELRDSWVWLQSGPNTDGAHNPVTTRRLEPGDILSLNCFPMTCGYYTALERTLFLGEPDAASLKLWEANVATHELGLSLIRPGARCDAITAELNAFLDERGLLGLRTFGYGHSFGVLSHYYGREAGLELREDVETTLAPGMVVSMEPMLTAPLGAPGAGGYREHDILVVGPDGAENVTGFPYGPAHNIV